MNMLTIHVSRSIWFSTLCIHVDIFSLIYSDVAERLKQLELLQIKWEEYERDVNSLNNWFSDQSARLDKFHRIGHEVSVQHSINECKVCIK